MPLYKLFCIAAHYPEYMHIKDLVSSSAKLLLDQGSAVREIRFLGTRTLPQRMRRHKNYHRIGDYWSMHFDASPALLAQLNARMRTDHRVVRWTMLKLGERLVDVADTRQRTVRFLSDEPDGGFGYELGSGSGLGLGSVFGNGSGSGNVFGNLTDELGTVGAGGSGSGSAGVGQDLGIGSDVVASLGGTGYAREKI